MREVRPRASELVGWGASQRARSASLDHLEVGRTAALGIAHDLWG
jgi:hypothetical protein